MTPYSHTGPTAEPPATQILVQRQIQLTTRGRGAHEITREVAAAAAASGVACGLCSVFLHHTSASLMLCENADPDVLRDLERFMSRAVPDGDPLFEHVAEGPDDMPAHVRTVLTHSSIAIPVTEGRLALGTWQGVFVWEHRHRPHERRITATVHGA